MSRKYTTEHIEFIATNIKGRSYLELTDMFNAKFGMKLKVSTMISLAFRNGLRNERDCRFNTGYEPTQFKKGHIPANKGKKGVGGWAPTQFKKGHVPANYKPVGSERVSVDGYVEVKVANSRKWKAKHRIVWQNANGPIPKGHVIIFADGNRQNIKLDNLLLISQRELAIMNKRGLITNDAELTKAGILVADISLKIGDLKKKTKGGTTK